MSSIRAALTPILLFGLFIALALWNVTIGQIARFSFLWDALLGVALGSGLCLLPALSGTKLRPNPKSGLLWIGAFCMLLLLCMQYLTLITGQALFSLSWLAQANGRSCVVEGAGLGYCATQALRGR